MVASKCCAIATAVLDTVVPIHQSPYRTSKYRVVRPMSWCRNSHLAARPSRRRSPATGTRSCPRRDTPASIAI